MRAAAAPIVAPATAPPVPPATPRGARGRAARIVRQARHPRSRAAILLMLLFGLVALAATLLAGIVGGLLRAGVAWPMALAQPGPWLGPAATHHAALMICGFLGTVIGIERAVALRHAFAFLAPAASAGGAVCLLASEPGPARALFVLAALVFVVVNLLLVRRQPAAHTGLLAAAALAWLLANLAFAADLGGPAVLAGWFTFLVLTIAAERLEMTRLMRRRPGALASFFAIVAALAAGAAASLPWPAAGGVLFGTALAALALWLLGFDIARRTVRAGGLSRYMAVCLLGGYAWLAAGGAAWVAMSMPAPAGTAADVAALRDLALHALGLGFVISMVMGHAPVILPALARIKVQFGLFFYPPLALLHGSLLWRFGGAWLGADARAQGATFNALAIALFALTMAGAALAWRRAHPPAARREPETP